MSSYLLPLGMILYGLGAFLQIAEEWKERGLTDTSFKSLLCLTLGPGLVAYHAIQTHGLSLAIASAAPAALAAVLLYLKLSAVVRSYIIGR